MEREIWKDIQGYEGLYQISNMGRVKSKEHTITRKNGTQQTIREKYKTLTLTPQGYNVVSLFKDGLGKNELVHRLVAQAFIPNPENKPFIDHIDTNPLNNKVNNLRWVTAKENNNNPLTKEHRSKPRNWKIYNWGHWKSMPVIQYSTSNKIINIFPNAFSTGIRHINDCCAGLRKTAGGYKWQYLDDYLADWLEAFQDECMEKDMEVVC